MNRKTHKYLFFKLISTTNLPTDGAESSFPVVTPIPAQPSRRKVRFL